MMARGMKDLNDPGVTLVELLVVFAIIAILVMAGAYQYRGWVGRYRVEGEVKKMYTDLMNARSMALARSRMFFLNVPASDDRRYRVFEDTYDAGGGPDGDRVLTVEDEPVVDVETTYSLSPVSTRQFGVDNKGMITNGTSILAEPEYIVFITDGEVEPDYDCLELTATRINMGLWNGTGCISK